VIRDARGQRSRCRRDCTAFDQGGELAAAVELRRLFPGITDNARARECARTVADWQPLPVKPVKKPTDSPRGNRSL
jgi:hypothetical protein